MTPDKIEELLHDVPEDEESRIEILEQIHASVKKLQETNSPELEVLAEKIGNGSRQGQWRIPLGKSGLLDFFLALAKEDDQNVAVTAQALRVIGNTCADQDENRRRVVESGCLPRLVAMLGHDTLVRFAVPVLFNICVDYEPAQAAAYKAGLTIYLVDIISKPRLREEVAPYMSIVFKLLGLVVTQEFEPDLVPLATPFCLFNQACASSTSDPDSLDDVETFLELSSAALTYLSSQQLQESFLQTPDAILLFLEVFQMASTHPSLLQVDDAEDQAQLEQLQSAFTETLANLSANPRFVEMCPLDSRSASLLLQWISSPAHQMPLQSAACLALGNLARSDAPSITLVQDISVHKALIAILSSDPSATDAQLLHSTLSFMKNLSIPASNKAILGQAGLLDPHVLPRIWDFDIQPQIQFDAVSLARLLLVNCPDTVRRVCALSPDESPSPSSVNQTLLHQLMILHQKADQEPTKMETARVVANVCRVLHSDNPIGSSLLAQSSSPSASSSEEEARLSLWEFYSTHHTLADVLAYLGLQAKFPVLRSELWFVLALMTRSTEGADVVMQIINEQPQIVNVLVEAVTGEKMPQGVASSDPPTGLDDLSAMGGALSQLEPQQVDPTKTAMMTKVDRENGLVLIAELLRRHPDKLPISVKNTFSQILKEGGELVLHDRNEKKEEEAPSQ